MTFLYIRRNSKELVAVFYIEALLRYVRVNEKALMDRIANMRKRHADTTQEDEALKQLQQHKLQAPNDTH